MSGFEPALTNIEASEGWGFESPSGAQAIKAVTSGNGIHGLLSVPQMSRTFP
jgi:hypothetical protein